jgi:hypothetical protein
MISARSAPELMLLDTSGAGGHVLGASADELVSEFTDDGEIIVRLRKGR